MRETAIAHLERLLRSRAGNSGARHSLLSHAEGAVMAYERLGLLSAQETARWRGRFADRDELGVDTTEFGYQAGAAAERFLSDVLDRVPPMRREPDPDGIAAAAECSTAIDALAAVGALDAGAEARWRARLLGAKAPWLDRPAPAPPNTVQAIWVPPENEHQAAEDAPKAAAWVERPKAREARRVIVCPPLRQDGLAVVALVVHEDATSVHFHHLDGPRPPGLHGFAALDAFSNPLDRLTPPALRDGSGRCYEPVDQGPSSALRTGATAPSGRGAISGAWLYTPAAPDEARAFRVEHGKWQWELHGS